MDDNISEEPVAYPPATPSQPPKETIPGKWSTGLYDCFDDPSTCFRTCCCPCVTFGQIAEIIDEGTTSWKRACCTYYFLSSCSWLYASPYRSKLRSMYSLQEEPCSDELIHCCCCVCSLTQEYRELKIHGLDPSKGWQANVERSNQDGVKVPPIAVSSMEVRFQVGMCFFLLIFSLVLCSTVMFLPNDVLLLIIILLGIQILKFVTVVTMNTL